MASTRAEVNRSPYLVYQSDPTAVASNITFSDFPKPVVAVWVGFNTYSNSDGTTPAAATAGTVDIDVKTAVQNQTWESEATDVSVVSSGGAMASTKIEGPVTTIRAVPNTAITGGSVSHYRMVVYAV